MKRIRIGGANIKAEISLHGAELCPLRNGADHELLWQASPEWPRHAPNLFPIVGRLKNDRLRHKGRFYPMTQHGFARDRFFSVTRHSATSCVLALGDDAQTRDAYPFSFLFEISYTITAEDALSIAYTIYNTGHEVLPASVGAHPAFRWPLNDGIPKNDHILAFSHEETAPTLRLENGLLSRTSFPNPVKNRKLNLDEELFALDAVIFDALASNSIRYEAANMGGIEISWDRGFRHLGLWAKPKAGFLCIEPWHGLNSPTDFDGEISEKPHMLLIEPGDSHQATYQLRLLAKDKPAL